ncbi:MAG: LysE family translocator [Candidatus Omnitrophica bacterium]|nr:LysE family translocator [Candidatus Omnitrophota bacterium]MCM8828522.1 LysE family translocator [Candidatus Omnitrophota bacterium]
MSLFAIALSSFAIALSGALSPGPLLAITVTRSLKYGAKQGPLLIFGHSILELVMVVFLIAGFGSFLKQPAFSKLLSIVGGCMLLLIAISMLKKKELDLSSLKVDAMPISSIFSGIIVSVSNPYWTIWWITIGLAYLSIALPYGLAGIIAFFIGHISADFAWYSAVSFSIGKSMAKITPFVFRIITICCSIFLVGFGIFLLMKAFI